ncbi:hypothetical protein FDP22_14565 [Paroceanicella profunda]|uniref:Uncharacterized protein n=1 Tax=Paroceanicella profunda TaxID=2579971 RepID=A0A5B8FIB0_9RHOB|nr:hypothetical protein [Paroceanicella profunda]QDL92898.1 hypothetical protein FDP22_14565 [Paroceanicella profunda]
MFRYLIAALCVVPSLASAADVRVIQCALAVPNTPRAGAQISMDGQVMTEVNAVVHGDSGRLEVDMTRLGTATSLVRIRMFNYVKEGDKITAELLRGTARLMLENNAVCDRDGCAAYWGSLDQRLSAAILGNILQALADPQQCDTIWERAGITPLK